MGIFYVRIALQDARIDCRTAPGDTQVRDIALIDLIERRIFGAAEIAAMIVPFAAARALLRIGRAIGEHHCCYSYGCEKAVAHVALRRRAPSSSAGISSQPTGGTGASLLQVPNRPP